MFIFFFRFFFWSLLKKTFFVFLERFQRNASVIFQFPGLFSFYSSNIVWYRRMYDILSFSLMYIHIRILYILTSTYIIRSGCSIFIRKIEQYTSLLFLYMYAGWGIYIFKMCPDVYILIVWSGDKHIFAFLAMEIGTHFFVA